jgi:hypothetical protein
MHLHPHRGLNVAVALAVSVVGSAHSQESVNGQLDSCIRNEQVQATAKGAVAGAMLGLLAGLSQKQSNPPPQQYKGRTRAQQQPQQRKDKTLTYMLAGAAIGGAAGFAQAYYSAVGTCYKQNTSWIPESNVQRSTGYEQVKLAEQYRPEMGVVAKGTRIEAPPTVSAGTSLPLTSHFIALSPDGSEADVKIERRLFAIADGKETELPFTGVATEQRKVEPGENVDKANLPIPAEMPVGTAFRYQFTVSTAGSQPSTVSANTTVN